MSTITEDIASVPAQGQEDTPEQDQEQASGALMGRIFEAALGFMELLTVYVGELLGLYEALAQDGPATAAELASRTGIDERYAREWLEQ